MSFLKSNFIQIPLNVARLVGIGALLFFVLKSHTAGGLNLITAEYRILINEAGSQTPADARFGPARKAAIEYRKLGYLTDNGLEKGRVLYYNARLGLAPALILDHPNTEFVLADFYAPFDKSAVFGSKYTIVREFPNGVFILRRAAP